MRNGNTITFSKDTIATARSYRTYEEWKLPIFLKVIEMSDSSYRTYEEWKPRLHFPIDGCDISSYRTYEEWKHS